MFLDEQAVEPNLLQKLHQGFFLQKKKSQENPVCRAPIAAGLRFSWLK